ncbi:MAG: hypothetical protein ACOY5C_04730 [Pseudomonadota bacterium]
MVALASATGDPTKAALAGHLGECRKVPQKIILSTPVTTSNPIKKMMKTVQPMNFNMLPSVLSIIVLSSFDPDYPHGVSQVRPGSQPARRNVKTLPFMNHLGIFRVH